MGDFTKLDVWNKAKNLSVSIYTITNSPEFSKDFDLRNQIRRAAISIPSNIAEGEELGSNPQSIRFFNIAKGSTAELQTQLIISKEIGYITESMLEELFTETSQISTMLTKIIKHRKINDIPQTYKPTNL